MVAIQIEMLVLDGPFLETIENCSKRFGTMLMKEDLLSNTYSRDLVYFSGFAEARLFLYRDGQNEIQTTTYHILLIR